MVSKLKRLDKKVENVSKYVDSNKVHQKETEKL